MGNVLKVDRESTHSGFTLPLVPRLRRPSDWAVAPLMLATTGGGDVPESCRPDKEVRVPHSEGRLVSM